MAVGLLGAAPAFSEGASPSVAAEESDNLSAASTVEEAASQARRTGRPVELTAERTETDTVYVNPAGTLTRAMATEPVRARTEDGWQEIDLDLVERDGRLEPTVSAVEMSFSAGGRSALVDVAATSGDLFSATWADTLPVPQVDGATARYRDVFDGVDLLMTATPSGYSHVLEVKTPEAAQLPELTEIPLELAAEGPSELKVRQGGFTLTDRFGREVLSSPDSIMWDSSGTDASRATPAVDQDSVEQQPAEGAVQAPVVVKATDSDEITLVPDQDMLRSPDTEFPVYIDPPVSLAFNQAGRAMTFKEYPSLTSWNWGNETSQGGQGVGYQNFDGVSTKRLFWQFNLGSKVAGATVTSATFMAHEVWAASCTKKEIKVYRTGSISSSTNWNNQPSAISLQDSKTVSFGREDCPADQAGDRTLNFDVQTAMQKMADTGSTTVTFQLRADEDDPVAWKRFAPKPNDVSEVLQVVYSFPPGKPHSLALKSPDKACTTGSSRAVIGDDAPHLVAKTSDRDAAKGQLVKMSFELRKSNAGAGGALLGTTFSTSKMNPENVTYQMPQADVEARLPKSGGKIVSGIYSWRPTAIDDTGLETVGPWCEFNVDSTLPGTPEIRGADVGTWVYQGAAVPVTFAPGPSTDVVRYAYAWNTKTIPTASSQQLVIASDSRCVASTKLCTLNLSLPQTGASYLSLWAFDAAGNPSPTPASVDITEATRLVATAGFTFNDVQDLGANSVSGGESMWYWGPTQSVRGPYLPEPSGDVLPTQRMEYALGFEQTGIAWIPQAAVATTNSFTVAVEVDPVNEAGEPGAELVSSSTAVSQPTDAGSAFRLGVDSACVRPNQSVHACYVFAVRNTAGEWFTARSALTATDDPGMVHLTGTYLAADRAIVLYVDGERADRVDVTGSLPASTQTFLGLTQMDASTLDHYFRGYLDEVELWTGAIGDPQALQIASRMVSFRSTSRPQ